MLRFFLDKPGCLTEVLFAFGVAETVTQTSDMQVDPFTTVVSVDSWTDLFVDCEDSDELVGVKVVEDDSTEKYSEEVSEQNDEVWELDEWVDEYSEEEEKISEEELSISEEEYKDDKSEEDAKLEEEAEVEDSSEKDSSEEDNCDDVDSTMDESEDKRIDEDNELEVFETDKVELLLLLIASAHKARGRKADNSPCISSK